MREYLRRSKRQRKETSYGNYFYIYLVGNEPLSFSEAISALDAKQWDKAIRTKIDSIKKNNTWTLVDLPKGEKPIGCKWIFKKIYHSDGSIEKYKARLVAKGFSQKPNIDYFDTFAPVTRISSIRVLLALASIQRLVTHQMDVKTTLLNVELEEQIYMTQPEACVTPGKKKRYVNF